MDKLGSFKWQVKHTVSQMHVRIDRVKNVGSSHTTEYYEGAF